MKKVYKLQVDSDLFNEWKLVLSEKENKRLSVIDSIDSNERIFLKEEERIKFFLINIQSDKSLRKEKPFQSDILQWTDDITLGAFKASDGVIISEKMKNIIEKYLLPNHYFYPLDIINSETLETRDDYYLFQVLGNKNDLTNFKESEYEYIPRRSKEVIKTQKGGFNNYEEYSQEYDRLFFNDRIKLNITSRIIETKKDIIPGYSNNLFISEVLFKEIKNIVGIVSEEQKDLFLK